jgi:hypothetical protein
MYHLPGGRWVKFDPAVPWVLTGMLGHMLVPASCKSESFHLLGFELIVLVFRSRALLLFMSGNCWFFLYVSLFLFLFSVFSCCFVTA